MEKFDYSTYFILAFMVIAWCILHSGMISIPVTEYLKKRMGPGFRFYRIFFNIIAILTLVPIALFAYSIPDRVIFQWPGYLRIAQALLILAAILLFYFGGRHYDFLEFLGIKQIRTGISRKGLTDTGQLDTSGILAIIRHPWYLGAILIIWARPLDLSSITINLVFTVYLITGTFLEEKKLIREFGDQYRAYQQSVSMLVPYKWLKSKLIS